MQQLRHSIECTQIDHDHQQVQYVCIDPSCTQIEKGMCEVCRYGNHLQHSCIEVKQLDELVIKAYEQEKEQNNKIYKTSCQRIKLSIQLLQQKLLQIMQELKDICKMQREESLLELLVETYVKNEKLNLEEYNAVRDLVIGNLDCFFGQYFWKKEIYTNNFKSIQQYSDNLLKQTILFTEDISLFQQYGIQLCNVQIQEFKEYFKQQNSKYQDILNYNEILKKEQFNKIEPIEQFYKKQLQKISSVDFSNKLDLLAIGGSDKYVLIIDFKSANCQQELLISTQQVYSVRFSPDDKYLIAGGSKPFEIYCWIPNNWSLPPIILRGHTNYVYRLIFSEDSRFLLSSSADKTAILWNIDKKLQQQIYKGHTSNVYGCAISIKSNRIATIGGDEFIIVYDQLSANILHQWKGHQCEYGGSSINYLQNGQLMISSGYDGLIKLWNSNNYELIREFIGHSKNWVWSISISQNQELFGSICNDYTIKIWDIKQNKPLLTLQNENNGAPGSEIILKQNQFVIATSTQSIKIWKLSQ
ncbi:unnamed protein product [Paramecium pentaurelia]|uniref:WD40-repeat-containing domain n=1 Tax=Paramecium pentaurelia TaxID=43138 RepID=A0A8S1XJT8_9CILI|nr:unnamed protein product [Paramecium pentaurelia]